MALLLAAMPSCALDFGLPVHNGLRPFLKKNSHSYINLANFQIIFSLSLDLQRVEAKHYLLYEKFEFSCLPFQYLICIQQTKLYFVYIMHFCLLIKEFDE